MPPVLPLPIPGWVGFCRSAGFLQAWARGFSGLGLAVGAPAFCMRTVPSQAGREDWFRFGAIAGSVTLPKPLRLTYLQSSSLPTLAFLVSSSACAGRGAPTWWMTWPVGTWNRRSCAALARVRRTTCRAYPLRGERTYRISFAISRWYCSNGRLGEQVWVTFFKAPRPSPPFLYNILLWLLCAPDVGHSLARFGCSVRCYRWNMPVACWHDGRDLPPRGVSLTHTF